MSKKHSLIFCYLFFLLSVLKAEIRLPAIFSENMVLQRDVPIKIWGWTDNNEEIEVHFINQVKKVKANKRGEWSLQLDPMSYGGPYLMHIKGRDSNITLKNILIGEVWLASGQSNMEWTVKDVKDAPTEIRKADYPQIRAFNVEKALSPEPKSDLNGMWQSCSPATVGNFSAVAYFFARKLYVELDIPVGIINSSWGGTDIETWTSSSAFNVLPEHFKERYGDFRTRNLEEFTKENEKKKTAYYQALNKETGTIEKWETLPVDLSSWKMMRVPQLWEEVLGEVDGVIWFKYNIKLSKEVIKKQASIHLGTIDDADITWLNGVQIGATNGHAINRDYVIPENTLKEGINTVTVRITDNYGGGGFYGNADNMYLEIDGNAYPLNGEWYYKESVTNKQFGFTYISPNVQPSLLFNAMINPIIPFPIKGVIWYQGENNAIRAYDYCTLFPTMINDWRAKWGYEFPFYWVQLANFMAKDEKPQESTWAELREAQSRTLALPKTGQAVITDIGDADDIHPRNKQDVGMRLALITLNKDYGKKEIVYTGPVFKSMQIEGNKAIIYYKNAANGLLLHNKYGYIEGFTIAGADKQFEWAKAYVDGNTIVVYSDKVSNPTAVRYSWSDNPDVNLFNKEGLPAVPFKTDDWKWITEK